MKEITEIMETEKKSRRSRRELIKTIAIVFLAVMLVLTFFSNTVMNMSLPQVSTQSAEKGNISEQIRGNGTVTTGKSYNVNADETRVISSVNVKTGDTVEKGDVLYTLEGKESTELEEAEKSLSDMQHEYRKALIAAEGSSGYAAELLEIENAEDDVSRLNEELLSFDDPAYLSEKYAAEYIEIGDLKEDISELEGRISEKYSDISDIELETKISDYEAAAACLDGEDYSSLTPEWYDKITAAADKVKSFENTEKTRLEERQKEIEGYIAALETDDMLGLPTDKYNRIASYITAKEDSKTAYDTAEANLKDMQAEVEGSTDYDDSIKAKNREISQKMDQINEIDLKIYNASISGDESEESTLDSLYEQSRQLQRDLTYLQEDLADLMEKSNINHNFTVKLKTKQNIYNRAKKNLDSATSQLNQKKREIKRELITDLNEVKVQLEQYQDDGEYEKQEAAKRELSELKREAKSEYKTAVNEMNRESTARKNLEEKKTALRTAQSALDVKVAGDKQTMRDSVREKERNVKTLKANLSVKQSTDSVTNRQADEDLKKQSDDIERQRKKVYELKQNSLGGTIKAPVSGIVSSLAYSAGETTTAGNPAAVIDMTDKGFILSFSVKTEQARKVTVGTEAEVQNNYFGSEITATLTAIKTDTSNPQTSKILEFTVTGDDVKNGDNISVAIGAKGQEYPAVIPNSAIREDSNGKYVLVVESASTALGSRYFARRYSVDVLAQNDSRTAVNGLTGSEFVITTSSSPIKDGEQVKLAET